MFWYFEKELSWTELFRRTIKDSIQDDVPGIAAQLAYYFFLALFPALLFLVALASFFPLYNFNDELLQVLGPVAPREVLALLQEQGREAAERWVADDAAEWAPGIAEHPEQMVEGDDDPGDEWFLEDADRKAAFAGSFREAVRQGSGAMAPQFVAQVAPWGFRLEEISIPVHVWAGAHDGITSPDRMRLVAERIPRVTFTVWDDVGHAGIAKHFREVLREL